MTTATAANIVCTRTFDAEDTKRFAEQSGDINPVHFGPNAIVHGMNMVSWAVSWTVVSGQIIVSVEVQFRNPAPVGSTIELRQLDRWFPTATKQCDRLGLYLGDTQIARVDVCKVKK